MFNVQLNNLDLKARGFNKICAIGDIHGCLTELEELLSLIPRDSLLLFLGDLPDRGPDSIGSIRYVSSLVDSGKAICLMGNHDETYLRYRKHVNKQAQDPKYKIPMNLSPEKQTIYTRMTNEDFRFLSEMPYMVSFLSGKDSWVAVHAGIDSNYSLEQQAKGTLTHIRYVNSTTGQPMSMGPKFTIPEGAIPWTEYYTGSTNILYGHSVYDKVTITVKQNSAILIGVDTGCCFGMTLSAVALDIEDNDSQEIKYFSVKAKEKYKEMQYGKDKSGTD